MHELSIALAIVDAAVEESNRRGGVRITQVHLNLGKLAGVVKEALLASYEMATVNSVAAGSQLMIEEVPVLVKCPVCQDIRAVVSAQQMQCVECGTFSSDIVAGRELEIVAIGDNGMNVPQTRLVQVRQQVLKQNDADARALRERFQAAGVCVVSLVSSPGSGKTTFLEKTLTALHQKCRVAALVGDLATDNDAVRLARSKAPVRQITTGTVCHLEAAMVRAALEGWDLEQLDYLFIENVGNLVCPATFDLGEEQRLVLFSVTEGEDKPLKYPTIFNTADIAIITKMDLAAAVEFDGTVAHANIQSVRPGMRIMEVSAKTGLGMEEWMELLAAHRATVLAEK